MEYRTLGKTGLSVSIVGYGASPLGDEFGTSDPAEGVRAVRRAIDLGINYFDVSPYYGRTLAEERLGRALDGVREGVILATKAGRYGKDYPEGFDFSAARIARSVEESLRRLGTDRIDVFQLHDIEYAHREQILGESLPAMRRLVEQGKVRYVGITSYALHLLADVASRAGVDTILSYCRYNLLDTSLDRVLAPLAEERGIGLINASPLHMRVLTARGAPDWHPAPRRVREAAERAAALCRERGVDLADLAMDFALANPAVATTLVGMSKVAHVERNVAAVGREGDPALLAEVRALLAPAADVAWQEGLPENHEPGAVPKGDGPADASNR
jgi:L-galactose dehydrogenase